MSTKPISRRKFTKGLLSTTLIPSKVQFQKKQSKTFPLGVASGDPSLRGVILWTKINPLSFASYKTLECEVSNSKSFDQLVLKREISSQVYGPSTNYTVHVDLDSELEPDQVYYYRFRYGKDVSRIGRTRTLPKDTSNVKLAVVSCQDYSTGYYHAYRDLVQKDAADFILHLGDFIYESVTKLEEADTVLDARRFFLSSGNAIAQTLGDFREVYEKVRSDSDLQDAMAQFPFICVWDDHEVVNNPFWDYERDQLSTVKHPLLNVKSEKLRAKKFRELKRSSMQAWSEYIPALIHKTESSHPHEYFKIYRKFSFGGLFDCILTDARSYRELNPCEKNHGIQPFPSPCADLSDGEIPSLLGKHQKEWFLTQMRESQARWRVWGNQFLFSQLGLRDQRGSLKFLNPDAWDGWHLERQEILNSMQDSGVDNLLILTGDMHASIISQVLTDFNSKSAKSLGIEIMTPAISSINAGEIFSRIIFKNSKAQFAVKPLELLTDLANPHINYMNLNVHGYTLVDIDASRIKAELIAVHPKNPKFVSGKVVKRFVFSHPEAE